jgi:hypothetical protein
MFFLGILGILQILFIPGLIILRTLNFKSRFIASLMAVITTSLIINYCFVFLLTVFHVYTRISLFIIIGLEIGLIIGQFRHELNQPIEFWFQKIRTKCSKVIIRWETYFKLDNKSSSFNWFVKITYIGICIILAYISLNWILKLFCWNLGSGINSYDAILSWNKWAIAWANNTLPRATAHYPQLLPAIWSILYLLIGNTKIQFFAQAIMPLFTFFILLMTVDLGFCKKNMGFFLGAALTYLVLKKFLGSYIIEGFADLPSAFFAFSAVYLLLNFQMDGRRIINKKEYGFFIAASAAGCAITKQVGLIFLLFFSILFFLYYIKPLILVEKEKAIKTILIILILVLIVVVPWYVYKQVIIWQGLENSEVQGVVSITENAFSSISLSNRFSDIGKMLGKYLYLLILIIPISFFVEPLIQSINLFLILPLFIFWGLFASYDFRNLAIALPLFGMSSGVTLQYLIERSFELFQKIPFSKITGKLLLIILVIIIILTGFFIFPDDLLKSKQTELAMNSFSPSINQKLVDNLKDSAGNYSIFTTYPIPDLPEFKGRKVGVTFNNFDDYLLSIRYSKAENLYFLIPKNSNQEIMNDITAKINNGKYELIFEDDSWIPYLFIKVISK